MSAWVSLYPSTRCHGAREKYVLVREYAGLQNASLAPHDDRHGDRSGEEA